MSDLDDEKKFYERFACLVGDRQLMQVFERYGYPAFRRSSVLEGFEQFIMANNFTGETVVEIGTLKALTSIVLARHFKRVVTVDIVNDQLKYEIAQLLGVTNIKFINVTDNHEKAAVLASYAFDAAFVDGDHAADTDEDFRIVKRCGRVMMHEHWPVQPAVMALFKRLPGNVVTKDKWALWTQS